MTLAERLIKDWQTQKTWEDNTERQTRAGRLIDYYNGDQLDWLEDVLDDQFGDPESLKLQLGMDNLTQMIADRISRVFDQPPVMTCEDQAGQDLIDALTKDGKLYLLFKTAEVYANLTCAAALHPWFDDKRDIIKTRLLPSSALWVIQDSDDPTEVEAVIYSQSLKNTVSSALTVEYTYWDMEASRRFDAANVDIIPATPNPYGVIPFAWMRDQIPVDAFFPEIGDGLIVAQDTLNVYLTELNQLVKMQSFSQPVFLGLSDPKSEIKVDPSKPIKIPSVPKDETQPDFKFVTPSAKIAEVLEAIRLHVERTASRYDIHVEVMGKGAVISGYALKLTEAGLNRRREDALPLARQCLNDWWKIVVAINNYHGWMPAVSPTAELVIDFPEPKYDEDPAIIDASDKAKIDMGVKSAVDVIMRDNPDLDEAAAIKVYEKNMSFKQTQQKRFGLADVLTQRPTTPRTEEQQPRIEREPQR